MKQLVSSVALLLTLIFVSACETSISGNYCTVAPSLTPKGETFAYLEQNDVLFMEQVYEHWALTEECPS